MQNVAVLEQSSLSGTDASIPIHLEMATRPIRVADALTSLCASRLIEKLVSIFGSFFAWLMLAALIFYRTQSVHVHIPKRKAQNYVSHKQDSLHSVMMISSDYCRNLSNPFIETAILKDILAWSFKFSKVLHNASQATVYRDLVQEMVQQAFDGFNGTVFAYGQTGAFFSGVSVR